MGVRYTTGVQGERGENQAGGL